MIKRASSEVERNQELKDFDNGIKKKPIDSQSIMIFKMYNFRLNTRISVNRYVLISHPQNW